MAYVVLDTAVKAYKNASRAEDVIEGRDLTNSVFALTYSHLSRPEDEFNNVVQGLYHSNFDNSLPRGVKPDAREPVAVRTAQDQYRDAG